MTIYERTAAADPAIVDEWDGGIGWIAHPDEIGRRASHALRGDDGLWILDPIDADGIDEAIAERGTVAGVAVCSNWHARDAGRIARRYDVPVHVPEWMGRVPDRVAAPIEAYATAPGDSGFDVRRWEPLPGWQEAILVGTDGTTVYVPESLGTAGPYTVGNERIGVPVSVRPRPPRRPLADVRPDRILVGHGPGVFDDATAALRDALEGARRRFPRALLENGPTQVRSLLAALRG